MHLLLVRHGQTACNVTGELDTAYPGADLTSLGIAQAQAIPDALKDVPVAGIYASILLRTQQTADPFAQARGDTVIVRPGLEEVSAGALEMRSDSAAWKTYAETLEAWMLGHLDRAVPNGPDGHAFLARYDQALRQIADDHSPDDTVVVFSHGGAMRVYTALRAVSLDGATVSAFRIMNTGAALLAGDPDKGWQLERWTSEPLGGRQLADTHAHDVTGESAADVCLELYEHEGPKSPSISR